MHNKNKSHMLRRLHLNLTALCPKMISYVGCIPSKKLFKIGYFVILGRRQKKQSSFSEKKTRKIKHMIAFKFAMLCKGLESVRYPHVEGGHPIDIPSLAEPSFQ